MANLRADNLTGTGGRNAIDGSIFLQSDPKTRISVTNTTGLDFGTDQFTIEFWIYLLKEAPVNKNIFARSTSNSGNTGMIMWFDSNGHLEFDSAHGVSGAVHTGASISTHTWHHIAVTRDSSNNTRLYLNGVNKASASSDTTDIVGATNLQIASNIAGDGYYNDAYISNFRMVKGTAVYSGTTDFTPPTEKLTVIDGTVLLCCQDSDNALQEATGKTITGYGRYEYLSGTNLVTNGSGNSVSGWTDANTSTFASTGGRIQVTRSGGSGNCSYQAITTVVGQQYTIRANIEKGSGSYGDIRVYTDSGFGTMLVYIRSNANTSGLRETTFTATTTTTHIVFVLDSNGDTAYYSDISVIAANRGKAPKVLPPYGIDEGVVFDGYVKHNSPNYIYFPTGDTAQRGRGRGVVLGGGRSGSPTKINTISYLEIPSTGISNDFGDLTEACIIAGCCASSTRGIRGGGYATPVNSNVIDYVTIATTSNATNFGDLTQARHWVMGGGSQTRGIFGGGNAGASPNPNTNIIDYITIASEGDAADFGDLINSYTPTIGSGNAAASTTRLLFAGGSQDTPAPQTVQNAIQYVTIASTGDATDFGDLTDNKVRFGVCSSSTRAMYGGGGATDTSGASITYVEIASTGNTSDFGDRIVSTLNIAGTSNSTRAVFIGGTNSPTSLNTMDYVTIATTGNAVDWGDSFYLLEHTSACSDSHGGIS